MTTSVYLLASLLLGFHGPSTSSPTPPLTCGTDQWLRQVDTMENQMDRTIRPCDDFYEYACGNWRAPYNLRAYHARDTLSLVRADNKRLLVQYLRGLEGPAEAQPQRHLERHERIVGHMYQSCANALASGNSSAFVYTEVLQQFSDWPILNDLFSERSANATFNWEYVSGEMRRYGVQTMWQLVVQPNWQASEQKILYLTPPSFDHMKAPLSDGDTDDDSLFLYHRYLKYILLDLGVRVRKAIRIANEIIEFEKQLFALVSRADSLVLHAPQTLESLKRQIPELDLGKYFATLLQDFRASMPADWESRMLIVANAEYVRKLARLLATTKAETIGKYLLVKFLGHFEVQKLEEIPNEKEYCLHKVNTFYPQQLAAVFMQLQHGSRVDEFLRHTEDRLNEIFRELKRQFESLINTTSVFERDAMTKVLGLEKLRAMRLILPNLRALQSDTVDAYEPHRDRYEENLLVLTKMQVHNELASVQQLFAGASFVTERSGSSDSSNAYGPLSVNAYYRLKKNAIEIPIGLLRAPLYDGCDATAKIHGSLVYIIAHELLHGFDYDGLNYDKSGNVANNWGAKSIISFGTKSSCYLGERYTNSALTINENIADSEGLRLALESFQAASTDLSPVELIDALRLFFVSFAQVWCGSATHTRSATSTSVHADHRERVNNVLMNFPEFADVYRCKEKSAMVAEERCRIW